jgi:hypothetical protein
MKQYIITAIILVVGLCGQVFSTIDMDETILFFPTYGYTTPDGKTKVRIHSWIHEPEESSVKRRILIRLLRSALDVEAVATKRFNKMARLFLVDNERGHSISIHLLGQKITLPESGPEGHSMKTVTLNRKFTRETTIPFRAILGSTDTRKFTGSVICIPPRGVSVITDIDDTIKVSNVLNKKEMIKNTFIKRYRAVPGMSRIYRELKKRGASFHYVSGSPWQLFVPLHTFMKRNGFPAGSMQFKMFRLKDRSGISFLSGEQIGYKTEVIRAIMKDFPERTFILIGDSGEKDPEVYAAIANEFKDRILAVCIRDVGSRTKDPQRYTKLFGSNKSTQFILFKNSRSLRRLYQLIQ